MHIYSTTVSYVGAYQRPSASLLSLLPLSLLGRLLDEGWIGVDWKARLAGAQTLRTAHGLYLPAKLLIKAGGQTQHFMAHCGPAS